VFKNLKEISAHHWLTATDVDVENLQIAKFIKDCFGLLRGELSLVTLAGTREAVDARKVACIGEFPCETDGGVQARLHLCNETFSGHE
jgi:hypothetical protein